VGGAENQKAKGKRQKAKGKNEDIFTSNELWLLILHFCLLPFAFCLLIFCAAPPPTSGVTQCLHSRAVPCLSFFSLFPSFHSVLSPSRRAGRRPRSVSHACQTISHGTSSSFFVTTIVTTRWVLWDIHSLRLHVWMPWRAVGCISRMLLSPLR